MLSFKFPFDACQLPLNGFDGNSRSFQTRVLPELARQKIAAIGMKSLGGDGRVIKKKVARVDDAMRYAMSLPVCTTVSGIDSLRPSAFSTVHAGGITGSFTTRRSCANMATGSAINIRQRIT